MLLHPPRRARRASIPGAILTACLCLLSPAAASAHTRAHLKSSLSEQSIATAPQQSASTPPSTPEPPAESSREERREERRERRLARAGSGCSIDLQGAPQVVAPGSSFSLSGTLSCPEAEEAANQTVTLYQKIARTPGANILTTASTEANGTFQFTALSTEQNSVYYVRCDGAKSSRAPVKVTPQVTLETPAAGTPLFLASNRAARANSSTAAAAVSFSGTVTPAVAGATVTLQRESRPEVWHPIGEGQVDDEGKYSIVHSFSRPGEAHLRVVAHCHGLCTTSASSTVSYQISPRGHKRVTIQSSANPLVYGLAVTINGTVLGAVNQPVTLLAQTGTAAYAPVAETVSSGDEYTFTVSPLSSTRYRVISASASSAVLAESVSYSLTPTAPAASVEVGEQITFTGSLAPAREGQTVDLERKNSAGLRYHVIAVGSLSALSTYSIAYKFPAAGSEQLRIRVPGDSEFASTSSEPFNIQVTPPA